MKCLVIETSPERTSAHTVTNEDGTPHIYDTMAEARAELKGNGYKYSRANDRYYLAGTEYRAYILREGTPDFSHAMREAAEAAAMQAAENAEKAARAAIAAKDARDESAAAKAAHDATTHADEASRAAMDAYHLAGNKVTPAADLSAQAAEHAGAAVRAYYETREAIAAQEAEALENVIYAAMIENDNAEDAVNAAAYGAYAELHEDARPDTNAEYEQLNRLMGAAAARVKSEGQYYGIEWEPYQLTEADEAAAERYGWTPEEMRETAAYCTAICDANAAALALIDAYAEAIGEHPTEDDPETRSAYVVARDEITGTPCRATAANHALVADMVETVAEHHRKQCQYARDAETEAEGIAAEAREAWADGDGEGLYRIAWSDGGQSGEPAFYESAEDLARDLASAYESATDTHLPYVEHVGTYERHELEAYLGDPDAYDVDAIEAEATAYTSAGVRYWAAVSEALDEIAERHDLARIIDVYSI